MKCSVTFRHMKSTAALKEYAEEKIDKISKLIERGGEAQVTLSTSKHIKTAHIELITDGSLRLRGVDSNEDMLAAIDNAVERIVRQVKRYRQKIKNHREPQQGRELSHQVLTIDADEPKVPEIVRTETIVAREMNVEEAVMRLDLLNTEFLVFTNAITHQVNVVYRLPDGQYGLIEARAA
ncbi:MAG: ribosome-associated translation inhibitor RaiA [Deltaproteobacteria bacterium]|jgi:putative sigma-54 modulation protein|nr:ribosome-associated translation inhibitor RaiA [Deltaproteobacteria bacterium]